MKKPQIEFLRSLCEAITPSGWETEGQRLVADYVRPFADSVTLDCHGNLHAVLNPGAPVRVMLDGHCDEIGLMVQYVDDKGFVYVQPIGGINTQLLSGECAATWKQAPSEKTLCRRFHRHAFQNASRRPTQGCDRLPAPQYCSHAEPVDEELTQAALPLTCKRLRHEIKTHIGAAAEVVQL